MSNSLCRRILACISVATLISACGGGGRSMTAGIDGTGSPITTPTVATTAYGTVTAFGSVYVNGIRFETDSAQFEIDGEPGTQNELSIGDVVLISGTLSSDDSTNGTATTVIFDDAVEGPVTAINQTEETVTVLGQIVRISADTTFDDSLPAQSIAGIQVGDVLEVSGLRTSDGSIQATRIEPKPASTEYETTGIVSSIDQAALTLTINALTVDFSSAMLNDFPGGTIEVGDIVEVKGGTTLGLNGELLATRVEWKAGDLGQTAGERAEVEGFITRFTDATDFDVAGIAVTTSAQTLFEGGAATDLGLDIKVEVEGSFDDNGVLVATKVDIRRSRAVRLTALVDSVDPATGSFVSLSITVNSDALTRIEDKSDQEIEPFSTDQLVAGDYVEVRGVEFPAGSGEILAGLIEREDVDTETELQGFVETVSEPEFSILGVTITTNAGTVFRDAADNAISAAAFFSSADGALVKAEGIEVADAAIVATEVEFEDE